MKSKICYIIISSVKKYAELHPKKEEKKEKKVKEEKKPKQEKPKQEKPKKQEKKKEEPEEEDDAPPPPKFVDPYAGLPKRYSWLVQIDYYGCSPKVRTGQRDHSLHCRWN